MRGMLLIAAVAAVAELAFWPPWAGGGMFLTGMIFGLKQYDFRRLDRAFRLTALMSGLLTVPLWFPGWENPVLERQWCYIFAGMVQLLLAIQFSAVLEKHWTNGGGRFFAWLNGISFFLFCAHSPVVSTLGRVLVKDGMSFPSLFGLWACIVVLTALICGVAFEAGKRIWPGAVRVLCGGRS